MFPKLDQAQIARLLPFGHRRNASPGEVIYDQGEIRRGFFVMLNGQLEVVNPSQQGEIAVVSLQQPGEFTGELDMLTGRQSLVRARAVRETELLEIDVDNLRRIVQTDSELSEVFLQAFLLRR